ncbi:hypothetical protein Scep_014766 [Stephania cephalantha]|uniref:Uncharacterized protein n=1 Tax=Stephania cephalantha TaxID=152367 RepID=A0AAP0P239_9MAGN
MVGDLQRPINMGEMLQRRWATCALSPIKFVLSYRASESSSHLFTRCSFAKCFWDHFITELLS